MSATSTASAVPKDPKIPDYDPRSHPPLVLQTQLVIALLLGVTAFLSFCLLRRHWPQLYQARKYRRRDLPELSNSLFGWIWSLHKISDDQILEHAGLDAFVFLGFFRTAIKLFASCTLFAVTIISPIRLHFTGDYDQGDGAIPSDDGTDPMDYQAYLWTYVVFTYIFTALTAYFMMRQSATVTRVRQSYLGKQNSITDRSVRFSGIPPELREENALKDHIESMGIGIVRSISLCCNWKSLDELFIERRRIIEILEKAWAQYLGPTWLNEEASSELPFSNTRISSSSSILEDGEDLSLDANTSLAQSSSAALQLGSSGYDYRRPMKRLGFLGLRGRKVDIIDYYSNLLDILDDQISTARQRMFKATGVAFVTMDSVASAQMAAQAVLDPRVHKLLARTAPAPHDVIWRNIYLTRGQRLSRTYAITLIIAITTVAFVIPISYLASLLQLNTIKKFWPSLARALKKSDWALTFVTGILPPFLFTLFNFLVPYFYVYLASLQGFVSHGDVELSVISKNFFFVFFNLFLVFTAAGTASNYWSFLKDTTQIAYELARSLRDFSLFYVDLIILQGIGMFPFRLLQIGSIVRFPLVAANCSSPRDFRNLYRPAIFNYGVHLPQPILILMIVLLYSVISTKILFFGTIYFVLGYFTYKYQLMYSWVHPQHSTGQAWPIIFRRVCLGMGLFHLSMAGILALQHAYFLATVLAPLPFMTAIFWYNFEENYVPLSRFIALRSIQTVGSQGFPSAFDESPEDPESAPLIADLPGLHAASIRRSRSQSKTLDEQREKYQTYVNPNLVKPLDGPWIGIEGDEVIFANSEGTIRRKVRLEEWE